MRASSRPGILPPIGRSKLYYTAAPERETHAQPLPADNGNFDSITLSSTGDTTNRFKDLVGRLTQEVLSANTTGDIRALRSEVASGTYQPDASAIAARIMFLGEGV